MNQPRHKYAVSSLMDTAYRGGSGLPKSLTKPITYIKGWKGSFFFIENKIVPSKYSKLLLEDNKLNKKSFKDVLPTYARDDPLGRGGDEAELSYLPSLFIWQDEVTLIECTNVEKTQNQRVSASSKAAGKRKQTAESSEREPGQKVRKVPPQARKVSGDASDPLDVDSDPDIHEFPSAKELKDSADCHFVVTHVTPPSWKRHLKEISLEMKLCDIHERLGLLCDAIWEKGRLKGQNPMLGKLTGFRVSIADLFLKRRNRSTMSRPCLTCNESSEKRTITKQNGQNQAGHENVLKKSKSKSTQKVKVKIVSAAKIQLMINLADIVLVRETPKVLLLAWEKFFEIKHREKQHPPEDIQELICKLLEDVQNISEELAEYINSPSWNRPAFYFDDDDDEESSIPVRDIISKLPLCVAITPDLPITDSLIMGDEHLSTNPKTESDELIKSSDENLVPIPSESEDFSDIESECDVPDCDDSQTTNFSTFSNPLLPNSTLVMTSQVMRSITIPPRIVNREHEEFGLILVLWEVAIRYSSPVRQKIFKYSIVRIIESHSTFSIPVEDSDSLREEIDIFPGPDDSIPPGIESDDYDSEGDDNSTSLPEFESFHVDYPDSGDSTIDVVEDIPVDVPNILPTHPTLHMDFDFIPSHNDLGSDLDVSSPSGDRNKIYDPRICIEVESTRFLATFSPVIDTLLPFSSENKDKVFNHGVLASKEKSPPSSSPALIASKLFYLKIPMLFHDENIRVLDVPVSISIPMKQLK
ncbi:hypothetical protein Tco_0767828 [Tanacetum coccineum]